MKQTLIDIIHEAVRAPSGDNMQPWRFEVSEDAIFVYLVPEADPSLYNYKQNASYMAIGCYIETIVVVANHKGLAPYVTIFPEQGNEMLVAKIMFSQANSNTSPLYDSIKTRVTNRHLYKNEKLSEEIRSKMLSSVKGETGVKLVLIEDEAKKNELGKIVANNEVVMLENKTLHDLFFNEMVWSEKEEKEKKAGLYFHTLALSGPPAFMFKKFKSWGFTNFMNKFGIAKVVSAENSKVWASGSAVCAVTFEGNTNSDFVHAGRLMQRVWLTAQSLGLSFQPLGGVMFLAKRILGGDNKTFDENHTKLLLDSFNRMAEIFGSKPMDLKIIFRIGYGPAQPVLTSRKEPNIVSRN